jgi:hypothetical protein
LSGIFFLKIITLVPGEWKWDKKSGAGTLQWTSGEIYTGSWVEDEITGKGTHSWPDGRRYIGDFLNSKNHGKGTLIYAKNDERANYTGQWEDNKKSGQGKQHCEGSLRTKLQT